ncbi:S1C family serine protease [Candidatus Parcubacteria bacterium]|nr:S1C family serine protease [Candidatus Parcubacteria bacterium]
MEHLTKQQIILLALFVSFFSSIATGIVTVSLLGQAPPAVSQTINRVVERTIERVSPSATTTKETVIVKDDHAAVNAIARVSKAVVRIYAGERFAGLGIIISGSGRIVAKADFAPGETLSARLDGGNIVPVAHLSNDPATGLSLFQADQSSDPKSARVYSAAAFADSDRLKLGQSAVLISGKETPAVATGIISSLAENKGFGTRLVASSAAGSFDSRSVLANLLGEVVGIGDYAEITGNSASFIPSNIIKTYAASWPLHN